MHPRLDEIRKRLLTAPTPSNPARYKAPPRPSTISSQPSGLERAPVPPLEERAEPKFSASTMSLNSNQTGPLSHEEAAADDAALRPDPRIIQPDVSRTTDGLADAVAQLFEPARECQVRLEEITATAEAITHLTRLALDLREPLKSFHDHIRKLSSSFESMRTFRDELGELAESFAPVRALHQQVIQMAQTVRGQLADVAKGLEPAKALQIQIAQLALAIDSVSELQDRFFELSEAFGDGEERSIADNGVEAEDRSGAADTMKRD